MSKSTYVHAPAGDFVLPFDLPQAGVRGRLVRLDATATAALSVRALPEAVARTQGECLALVTLLGSLLKLDGRLTVQTKSEGPLDMAVADYYGADSVRPRGVRSAVRFDSAKLSSLGKNPDFATLAGAGALAITIRPRVEDKDYQGVVPLSSEGLSAGAEAYFAQSEQLATKVRLAAAPLFTRGATSPQWRAGGLLLQATPDAPRGAEDWERVSMLAATVEDLELVDTELTAETLLWRLFNQEDVRLQPAEPVTFRCDCSRDNITQILAGYSAEERRKLADPDGFIRATCEFCGAVHAVAA